MAPYETDLFGALLDAAEDWEADVIEAVALRSGYLWKCERSWVNRFDELCCTECGRPRAECEVISD